MRALFHNILAAVGYLQLLFVIRYSTMLPIETDRVTLLLCLYENAVGLSEEFND